MSLITNHTTAGLVLRAPGLASLGDPVDEDSGYKALGDAMAKENGYFSQKSFELYDTTGTTEDWSYNATGGFGFTFELYCGAPNYETGDCDDPAFHPTYQRVVEEWDGTNPTADHTNDPGPNKGYDGKGNREAYYIAAETALDEQRHSILEASVPPGTTLRLRKDFKTETFPQGPDGGAKPIRSTTTSRRPTTSATTARSAGTSTRRRGRSWPRPPARRTPGQPSAPETRNGSPAGAADDPVNDGAAARRRRQREQPAQLQRPPDHRPGRAATTRRWASTCRLGHADERLRREAVRGHQRRRPLAGLASPWSARARTARPTRRRSPPSRPGLQPGKKYVLRVNNFAAVEPYTVTVTYVAPLPFKPAQVESYTLTCERGGQVFDTQQVQSTAARPRARPEGVRGRDPARVRGEHDRAALGQRGAPRRRRPLRLQALRQPAGADRRLPGLAGPPGDRRAPRGALQVAPQGRDLERPRRQGRRAVLRPLPDEDAQRQGHGVPPRRPAAAQRPLLPPAGLLPPLDVRPAAELQARAGRVRRHAPHAAADRLPRRGRARARR